MHIAVGEKSQQVQGLLIKTAVLRKRLPGGGGKQRAGLDALAHQASPLRKHLAAAKRVVAHFGIAHIAVRWKPDGGAVGLQLDMGAGGEQTVQIGGVGMEDGVSDIMFSDADAIENDEYNRFHLQCSSTYCALKRIKAGQISLFGPFCSSSLHWREPNCA